MEVKLPNLGEGADSGVVVSVLVKEGDEVTEGQTLLELENEKAVAPIPSPASGKVLSLKIKEGDKLSVGQTILTLEEGGDSSESKSADEQSEEQSEDKPAAESSQQKEQPVQTSQSQAQAKTAPLRAPEGPVPPASPSVRRIARDIGLDLRWVTPSEQGGRVVLKDIQRLIQHLLQEATKGNQKASNDKSATAKPIPASIDFSQWGEVVRKPMSNLRQVISRRMTESATTIPHVTQFGEADITDLMVFHKKMAPAYKDKGTRLTLTPILLKTLAVTLKKHPIFNSSYDETAEEIVYKEYVHLGIAVDTEAGLMVPVIRDVDRKNLVELSMELETMATKTRDRKVSSEDMKGGSFTVSNQGSIGGSYFTPIINKPEVAILGLGKGTVRPAWIDEKVQPRTYLPLAVSYDHRLIDGGAAARFVVDYIEELQKISESDLKPA